MKLSKTTWTLIATCVVLAGNAILNVVPQNVSAVLGTILSVVSIVFHVNDVNTAVASAKAPNPPAAQQ
jgi:hypothetical protein